MKVGVFPFCGPERGPRTKAPRQRGRRLSDGPAAHVLRFHVAGGSWSATRDPSARDASPPNAHHMGETVGSPILCRPERRSTASPTEGRRRDERRDERGADVLETFRSATEEANGSLFTTDECDALCAPKGAAMTCPGGLPDLAFLKAARRTDQGSWVSSSLHGPRS
jgi:hypothetical protein